MNNVARNAYRYNQLLAEVPGVACPQELATLETIVLKSIPIPSQSLLRPVYHQYTILVNDRDTVAAHLASQDIGAMVYYPVPLHLQEVHADLGQGPGSFPHAEAVAKRCLSLPMFPELSADQQTSVVAALKAAVTGQTSLLKKSA